MTQWGNGGLFIPGTNEINLPQQRKTLWTQVNQQTIIMGMYISK